MIPKKKKKILNTKGDTLNEESNKVTAIQNKKTKPNTEKQLFNLL